MEELTFQTSKNESCATNGAAILDNGVCIREITMTLPHGRAHIQVSTVKNASLLCLVYRWKVSDKNLSTLESIADCLEFGVDNEIAEILKAKLGKSTLVLMSQK